EFLKDICDDLDDNECMEAIDELIKEHGGLQKTEEEYQEMIEKYSNVEQEDPIRIAEVVNEAMLDVGEPSGLRERVVKDILMYFNVPEWEEYAREIVSGSEVKPPEAGRLEEVRKVEVAKKKKSRRKATGGGRKRKQPYLFVLDALRTYVIVGKPLPGDQEVSGLVQIGRVGNQLRYLVVPSEDAITRVIKNTADYAEVEVSRGWLEVYGGGAYGA
ncbi:hypothetical protein J7M00_06780, partial [bacterium]|nr:hypothetical protein [bacterium]